MWWRRRTPCPTSRRYVPDTLVLETEWSSASGTVRVIDFMPPRGHAPDIVRIVHGISGAVPTEITTARLRLVAGGLRKRAQVGLSQSILRVTRGPLRPQVGWSGKVVTCQ